jgi:hypothetical protein
MILSHDWRFIFFKTEKTGSTSVEMALAPHCGPLDVVTPIHSRDEAQRHAAGVRARNFAIVESAFRPENDPEAQEARIKAQGPVVTPRGAFYNHMGAAEIRTAAGARIFERYFKFAVERDPRERLVSYYFWLGRDKEQSFRDFVAGFDAPTNWDRCTIDGKLALDRLIRHDRLAEGLREVTDALGLPWDGTLPRAKSGYRPKEATIAAMFDQDIEMLARERMAKDFELYAMAR